MSTKMFATIDNTNDCVVSQDLKPIGLNYKAKKCVTWNDNSQEARA